MLGIDITKISRFKNANDALIKRMLHPNEIKEYKKSENKELFLARKWAIKEALFKADNKNVEFKEIEIFKKNRKHFFPGYIITTTKEDDYYVAVVMKEQNER